MGKRQITPKMKSAVKKSQKSSKVGKDGEEKVAKYLSTLKYARVINNFLIHETWAKTQIDHIVITGDTVYVIETKNNAGVISEVNPQKWVVEQFTGAVYDLYNPAKQNMSHINVMKTILKGTNIRVVGLVVFPNDFATLKVDYPTVVQFEQFKNIIRQDLKTRRELNPDALNLDIRDYIHSIIKNYDKGGNKIATKNHLKHVKHLRWKSKVEGAYV